MRRPLSLAISLVVCASLAAPAVAGAPEPVTRNGVGKVKRGATHKSLRAKGLLGPQVPGCELAGPNQKAAKLKAPLEGAVELTRKKPRRVRSILVTDGAEARGVGFGDKRKDILREFPHAKFDSSTEEVFGITLATVPRKDGGRFQFGVDAQTRKITLMGVPYIAFCE